MRRYRVHTLPALLFLPPLLGASVTPSKAQSTDQVWSQLQSQTTVAVNDGYKRLHYIIGWLDNDAEPLENWPVHLVGGSSYLITGVCDNDCADVDLSLEDKNRAVMTTDVLEDDLPMLFFTPKTSATYWIRTTMVQCSVNPCGYGIAVFVR